ncbi:uncharacterized protein [Nicotiana sylvestris]|uniref:uncharacterized protein n=1 Tax=Nicotiana sylvestris TaxID=4096 RepID=UPI00388CA01F
MHAKGFDLSAEIEEVKALEEESAALTTSEEGSAGAMSTMPKSAHWEEGSPTSASCPAGGTPPVFGELTSNYFITKRDFPIEKPLDIPRHREHASRFIRSIEERHLEAVRRDYGWGKKQSHGCQMRSPILRQLAASSTYDECNWRDLSKGKWEAKHHGIDEFSKVRPSPFKEEEKPLIFEIGKDKKRKSSSKDEDSHSKAGSARGREEDVVVNEDLIFIGRSVDINAHREDDSILMARTRRPPETVKPAGLETPSLEGEIPQARKGEGPSLPVWQLVLGRQKDFDKLKSEQLRCEAKLRKALNGEKSLRLLCDKKTRELIHLRSKLDRSHDYEGILEKRLQRKTETQERLQGEANQVNSECNKLKAQIDAHVASKRNALAKASALEIQLCNAQEGDSVQASRIAKLETNLLKMKAEVVDARTEAEKVRAKADKKVAFYVKDTAEARTKLRGASDRERRSNEYARRKSRRETLEEIHG